MIEPYIGMNASVVRRAARRCLAHIYRKRKTLLRKEAERVLTWPMGLRRLPDEKTIRKKMRALFLDQRRLRPFHLFAWGYAKSCLRLIKAADLAPYVFLPSEDAEMLSPFVEGKRRAEDV